MSEGSRSGGGAAGPAAELVIVHSSDLHVDDGYTARLYGGDGAAALRCVLEAARNLAADVVLLAGDVFEHNRLPDDLLARAARLLDEAGRPVVMLPGNHDPATPESAYRRGGVAEPDNVHVLGVTHDEAVVFPDLGLEIWGHAHFDYDDMPPLRGPRTRTTRWQIAMAHGHYEPTPDPETALRPSWLFGDADIAATGADYLALGHWNTPVRVGDGSVEAHYSGSPDLARTVNVVRLSDAQPVAVSRAPLALDLPGRKAV